MFNSRGTYVLVFSSASSQAVQIGALGVIQLRPGWYLYVGSAFGAGGLRSRLRHHLHSQAAPRWHLDYLRSQLAPQQVWFTCEPKPCEHDWAAACLALPGAEMPLPRFGASDCACPAHLVRFTEPPKFLDFTAILRRTTPQSGAPEQFILRENSNL